MKIPSSKNKILAGIAAVVLLTAIFELLTFKKAMDVFGLSETARAAVCGCAAGAELRNEGLTPWNIALALAAVLFAVGILAGLTYLMLTLYRTRKFIEQKLVRARPWPGEMTVFKGEQNEAFTFGLLRPKIAVSERCLKALPRAELEAVLKHEAHHVRNRDPLKFLILDTLKYTFFFVPLIVQLSKNYKIAAELEADSEVSDRSALSSVLLRLTEQAQTGLAAAAFAASLKIRIERLVQENWQPKFWPGRGALAVTLLVMLGFGWLAARPAGSSSGGPLCRLQETRCLEIMSKDKQF